MNLNKFLKCSLLIIAFAIGGINYINAQDKNSEKDDKKTKIRELIENKDYTFIAQSANPMGGRFINLTSLYEVKVAGDTLLSDLPYFGRAFVAPINPTESALRFTSTDYNYKVETRKKGGWDITIIPNNQKEVRQMLLNVSENGYARMQVLSNNRQPISFNGYIKERKVPQS